MSDSPRREAVLRILGLAYLVFAAVALLVLVPLVLLWMVVDVVWQLLTGQSGPEKHPTVFGRPNDVLVRLWTHTIHNIEWVLFGAGHFQFWP